MKLRGMKNNNNNKNKNKNNKAYITIFFVKQVMLEINNLSISILYPEN